VNCQSGRSTRPLVHSVLKPIWEIKTVTASRVRARIENVLDWATASELRTGDNPAKAVAALLPKKSRIAPVTHHKAMAYDDVPAFVAKLANLTGDAPDAPVAPKALEFLILTTARSEEVRGLRRPEIDFKNKVWTVPADRIKGRKLHRVPLVDRAIQILQSLPTEGELFFIGSRKKSAIGDNVMLDLIEAIGHDATVHGFRSSFRDWAEEQTNFSHEAKEVNALIRSPRRRWRGAFLRGRAVLGGVCAFGGGYGLARISAFTYRRRLWEPWAHSRRPSGPTHRGSPFR
jgi:integrase